MNKDRSYILSYIYVLILIVFALISSISIKRYDFGFLAICAIFIILLFKLILDISSNKVK